MEIHHIRDKYGFSVTAMLIDFITASLKQFQRERGQQAGAVRAVAEIRQTLSQEEPQ